MAVTLRAAAVAVTLVLAAGCRESRTIGLAFAETFDRGLSGFNCVETSIGGAALAERVTSLPAGQRKLSVVVDFLAMDGAPACRAVDLVNWCAAHPCAPIAAARRCVSVDVDAAVGREMAIESVARGLAGLSGPIIDDAPDEQVVVRVIGTAQPCAEIMAGAPSAVTLDCHRLVGCAYSCPIALDSVDGDVAVALDTLTRRCEAPVAACAAAPPFSDADCQ